MVEVWEVEKGYHGRGYMGQTSGWQKDRKERRKDD
jgi:hypothetical protein